MYINLLSTDSINKLLTYAERINIRSVVEVAVN